MTSHDIERLKPILNDLQRAGFITTYSVVSWADLRNDYEYAFRVNAKRLTNPLLIHTPFTEDELRWREAMAYTRQEHHAAITSSYTQSEERLIRDLAVVYKERGYGKDLPIPQTIVVKEIVVDLRGSAEGGAGSTGGAQ